MSSTGSTIDPAEVEKFSRIAAEWWNPTGKFRPLHRFNPVRLAYIRQAAEKRFDLKQGALTPLAGLRLLDVGCGGGLVSEPMRRLGAEVVAIDASDRNIKTARVHAAEHGLDIDYRQATVESLVESGEPPFDIVLNLEVVEHVADPKLFLNASASLVADRGLMIVATINRTLKATLFAKFAAEYVLRWLPVGAHDPSKFLSPSEIEAALDESGMRQIDLQGVAYHPLGDEWRLSADTSVNYIIAAVRRT